MLGLAQYRADLCPDCHYPRMFHDQRYHFGIEVGHCPIRGALDRFGRIQSEADEKVREQQGGKKRPVATPDPADGRQVAVSLKPTTKGR